MIRKFQKTDIDRAADIWLNGNLEAHSFIPAGYWKDNFDMVKKMLESAEIYVYEDEKGIQGFAGLNGCHIEGIFVEGKERSKGIGRQLLEFVKNIKEQLSLNVYMKNEKAMKFYLREGFIIQEKGVDPDTGEQDCRMIWKQQGK